MHRSYPTFATLSFAALAALFAPASASASPHRAARVARLTKAHLCAKPPVVVVAGAESATVSLSNCDGTVNSSAVDQLSILARPGNVRKPTESIAALDKVHGPDLAPGIRRVDPRLALQLEQAVDHFHKDGQEARIILVSGYRPKSSGSYHAAGKALDFRIEGVSNDALVTFCKTLPDTGCGYYPNSVFVHMDVREPGAGHVAWVDTSRKAPSGRDGSGVAMRTVSSGQDAPGTDEIATETPPSGQDASGDIHRDKSRAVVSKAADDANDKLPVLPAPERARKKAAVLLSVGST